MNVPFLLVLYCRWSVSVQEAVLLCISDQTLPFQFFLNKATHLEVDGSEWSIQPTYWNYKWCYQNLFFSCDLSIFEKAPLNYLKILRNKETTNISCRLVSQRKNIHRYLFVGRPQCLPQGFRNCSKASLYTTWLLEIGTCEVTPYHFKSWYLMSRSLK